MAEPVITFDGVWKKFRRGERHDSLRDLIPALVSRAWRRAPEDLESQEFWAVRDVSFTVRPGEALGIVGSNGAGKSTILKLLTRILRPTKGRCRVDGRVGALIEVASSFSGDLTGRENVFLQGAIMGMTRAETASRFDEIVDFAEVGPFIDTPVKRYSNGMNARLGFSIAAHLDPQALIIDEVLSVGDLAFQERCLQRMLEFKRRGAAIVFVSHNVSAVAALCNRALVVSAGRARFSGPTADALEHYLQMSHGGEAASMPATIERAVLTDAAGRQVTACGPASRLRITAWIRFAQAVSDVSFGLAVYQASSGVCAYGAESRSLGVAPQCFGAGDSVEVAFGFEATLARGHYLIELYARCVATDVVVARSHPAAFLQIDEPAPAVGIADLRAECRVRNVTKPAPDSPAGLHHAAAYVERG